MLNQKITKAVERIDALEWINEHRQYHKLKDKITDAGYTIETEIGDNCIGFVIKKDLYTYTFATVYTMKLHNLEHPINLKGAINKLQEFIRIRGI